MGSWEFLGLEVNGGSARIGDRNNGRLGPAKLLRVDFDRALGLQVTTSQGTISVPAGDCHVVHRA